LHGDLIAKSGKAHLLPIGMKRKGKSRVWLKDNRWWLAIVEFQPSAWNKGTYLNIAASWLWYPKNHLAFDELDRVENFAEFADPQGFALAADRYASRAASEVRSMETKFSTLDGVARHLRSKADGNPWHHYHAMMASLANGELTLARNQQEALSRFEHNVPWCTELKAKAAAIMVEATDTKSAKAVASREVTVARERLKLSALEASAIWRPSSEA
jgi:hypothetical protein